MARLHEPRLAPIYDRHGQQMNKHHDVAISHVAATTRRTSSMQSVPVANLTTLKNMCAAGHGSDNLQTTSGEKIGQPLVAGLQKNGEIAAVRRST